MKNQKTENTTLAKACWQHQEMQLKEVEIAKHIKKNCEQIINISESESEVTQSSPTLCDPVDCSPPGSSVHGILQARILE